MKVRAKTTDPWQFVRDRDSYSSLFAAPPRTQATISISPADAMHVAWYLFWGALKARILRRQGITFSLEDDGR